METIRSQILALRTSRRAWIGAALLGVVAIVVGYRSMKPLSPLEVIKRLDKTTAKSDRATVRKLCTEQGFDIMLWGYQHSDDSKPASTVQYGEPVFSGEFCDIPASSRGVDSQMMVRFRLVNQSGWKFHDIYIEEVNGKKAGLWVSYAKDHPYRTAIWLNWRDMLGAFFAGLALGVGG